MKRVALNSYVQKLKDSKKTAIFQNDYNKECKNSVLQKEEQQELLLW